MSDPVEALARLEEIIRIQTDVIDGLFLLVMQHISTEDEGLTDILEDMETAAALKKGVI